MFLFLINLSSSLSNYWMDVFPSGGVQDLPVYQINISIRNNPNLFKTLFNLNLKKKYICSPQVACKIFLEFSRTVAVLPDDQCPGSRPEERRACTTATCQRRVGDSFVKNIVFKHNAKISYSISFQ